MKSYIKRIIVICITEFLLRGIIAGNSDLIFLVACNILILGIIFYDDLRELAFQAGKRIISLHRYKPEIVHKFGEILYYLFKHYLFILSIVLLLLSIFDRLFINYFYLSLGWCVLFFAISTLILLPLITEMKFFFAGHELRKINFARGAIVIFFLVMLITLRALPLYQTYFYSLLATLVVSLSGFLIFEKKPIRVLFHSLFFQAIGVLTFISLFVFLWNIFPQIKHACTITQKIYIDRPIYLDKIDRYHK